MENKLYTKKEILNDAINAKGKDKIFTLFFKINHLTFGVQYQPWYFNSSRGLSHFSFYAISRGFEKFTETGFRSLFVQNTKKVASYEEIKDYFIEVLKRDIVLESSKPMQLQLF